MLIAFSVKCHGEGSVYYSSQSIIYVLPTFISWRYWSPESWKTPKWAFPAAQAQRADHGSHQPSCTHHREQIHEPQHLFSACPHLKANHSLCSSTSGWVGGELSQCFSPCFPAPGELLASPVCCVCGFCCLLPGFITYATSVEQNPLSSLVLGSFAGWHWRYIWTLGTVLLERQVRICQNTTVYTCRGKRKKKKEVGFYSQSFCCGQMGLVHPRGDSRFSGHFPACRHLLCITLKMILSPLPLCLCLLAPRNLLEVPWPWHTGCVINIKELSLQRCSLWTEITEDFSADFCSKVFNFH